MISPAHTTRPALTCAVVLALCAAGCASKEAQREAAAPAEAAPTATGEAIALGDSEDEEAQDRPATGVEALVRTNNAFAFDLYRATRAPNQVISPHGVATALALVHAGAGGATRTQVAATLRSDLAEADLQEKFGLLHAALRERAAGASRDEPRGFRLRVTPAIWLSDRVQPAPAFVNAAADVHVASTQQVDFVSGGRAATLINAHHTEASGGRIGEVVASLGELSRLIVTTTVQWDAPWALPFERALTREAPFEAPTGARSVPMMQSRMRVAYLDGDGFEALELPYADGAVSAWVILPDPGNAEFDATLTPDFFEWIVANARQRDVDVRLPRFELRTRLSLRATLGSMGMPDAFDASKADFGALAAADEDFPLFLDDIVSVTRARVDEDGSDAAAPVRGGGAVPGGEVARFNATRPFVFVVRDGPTGVVLAMAKVSEP